MIRLYAHPHPTSPVCQATHRKTEKERQVADRKGGEGDGRGAVSDNLQKAWLGLNHLILSGPFFKIIMDADPLSRKLKWFVLCTQQRIMDLHKPAMHPTLILERVKEQTVLPPTPSHQGQVTLIN